MPLNFRLASKEGLFTDNALLQMTCIQLVSATVLGQAGKL